MQEVGLSELFAQQVHISRLGPVIRAHIPVEKQPELLEALAKSGAPGQYRYLILGHLMRLINNSTDKYIDELSEAHAEALVESISAGHAGPGGPGGPGGGPSTVIYRWPGHEIRIKEERHTLARAGGTGYRTWEAALALGDYLIEHPLPQGTKVIELGAGTGFVTRVLGELGYDAVATDGDPQILELLPGSRELWWETVATPALEAFAAGTPRGFVIVASDVLYDPNNYAPFCFTVSKLLERGSYAIVATTMRNQDTYAMLGPACDKVGLEVERVGRVRSRHFYLDGAEVELVRLCNK